MSNDELIYVCHAKKSYTAWPITLIFPRKTIIHPEKELNMTTPSPHSASSQASTTRKYVITEKEREMVTSTWLRVLNMHAMVLKKRGVTISIPIPKCTFLDEVVGVTLDYEDLIDWCFKREVGESQMNIFMKYLKGHCQNEGVSGMYGFCDTNVLSPLTPTTNEKVRSDYLAHVFGCNEGKNVNQLFFAPYNDNVHSRLAVISPWNGLVFWLDPAGAENEINEFAKKIINEGIIKFSMVHRKDIKKIKKNPKFGWKQPKCPRQPQNSKVCGYYVCRYMLEIIEKRFFQKDPCTYSTEI